MLISLIVPIYNSSKTLKRCVDSIINQTYKNLEIILVDDGSSDESVVIGREYVERDNRVSLYSKANGGVSSARNYGLKFAQGDYIGFVDSDDIIEPNMVKSLVGAIEGYDLDIAMCGVRKVHEGKDDLRNIAVRQLSPITIITPVEAINGILDTSKYNGYVVNKVFSRKIIFDGQLLQFREDIHMSEDLLFCIQAFLRTSKIGYDDTAYYYYMLHGDNATSSYSEKKITLLKAFEEIFKELSNIENVDIGRFHTVNLKNIGSLYCQSLYFKDDIATEKIRLIIRGMYYSQVMSPQNKMLLFILKYLRLPFYSLWRFRRFLYGNQTNFYL